MLTLSDSAAHSIIALWYSRKATILGLCDTCLGWNTIRIDFPFLSGIVQDLSPQRFVPSLGDPDHSAVLLSAIQKQFFFHGADFSRLGDCEQWGQGKNLGFY